ncbi:unnamed protein product [Effrenium voratum]|nr:unnamed protein product [Effrenium voratum]
MAWLQRAILESQRLRLRRLFAAMRLESQELNQDGLVAKQHRRCFGALQGPLLLRRCFEQLRAEAAPKPLEELSDKVLGREE